METTMRYDAQIERGQDTPIRLVITDCGALLAEIEEITPEAAICTAICLLEATHQAQDRQDGMALAVATAAKILNSAAVVEAETLQHQRRVGPITRRDGPLDRRFMGTARDGDQREHDEHDRGGRRSSD